LCSSRVCIDNIEHGVSCFSLPCPLDRFLSFLVNLKLPVEAFDSCQGIVYLALDGDPELILFLCKLQGNILQDLGGLFEDLKSGGGRDVGAKRNNG
jgi:hypothetical protein